MDARDLKAGDKVLITAGTFTGHVGTVTRCEGEKVLLTLTIFGRVTDPIPIQADYLQSESSA